MSVDGAFLACRSAWKSLVDQSIKAKKDFQRDADECRQFYNGPYSFIYGMAEGSGSQRGAYLNVGKRNITRPSICMSYNKVAEGKSLFGPVLYSRNPQCKVNARRPPEIPEEFFGDMNNPQIAQQMQPILQQMSDQTQRDAMRSILLSAYLNYLPTAIDLKSNSRSAIDETIISGMGLLWAKMDNPAGGHKQPVLEYDSIDNLLIDPDCEQLKDAKFIMRRFVKPVWEVEQMRGLPRGTLRGNYESHSQYAAVQAAGDNFRKRHGKTNDLLVYWGIWSKMGIGGLLRGISEEAAEIDRYGQYVYVEVCDSYNYFLNAPQEIWGNDQEVRRRLQWETPFYADVPSSNGWPFTQFKFHDVPRSVWPMGHFKPALGVLEFLNWGYSFLISGMQKRSRDFMVVPQSMDEETQNKILEGDDLTLIKISQNLGIPIDQLVAFIQHPGFPEWQFKVLERMEVIFEKNTGLTELMYGQQESQDRSATATEAKQKFVNIRPDDMREKVEESMTDAFRKLAMMARWHMRGSDIGRLYGPVIGKLWTQFVETADVSEIIHALEYRIEAGSTKKPNKERDQDNAKDALTTLMSTCGQFATQGVVEPYNALITYWGRAFDIDVKPFLIPPPPPPQPPVPDPPKYSINLKGEDVIALGLDEAVRMEFGEKGPAPDDVNPVAAQMTQEEALHKQELRHNKEKHDLDQKHSKEKAAAQKKKILSNGKK